MKPKSLSQKNLTLLFIFIIFGLSGCSFFRNDLRQAARNEFSREEYVEAEKKMVKAKVIAESKNRLLTLTILGIIAHNDKKYEKSNFYFYKAKKVSQELWTKSVGEYITSGISNDLAITYPGMDYENSYIFYYLVLNHLMIFQNGFIAAYEIPEIKKKKEVIFEREIHPRKKLTQPQKIAHLRMARSNVLAWDSFLKTVRARNNGKPLYKDSLLAKLLGAWVHRVVGTFHELNIAKILYQDASKLLKTSFAVYPSFNAKSEMFYDNYEKFYQSPIEVLENEFIEKTNAMIQAEAFIEERKPGRKALKKPNLLVVLEEGIVNEKKKKTYTFGISTLVNHIEDPGTRKMVDAIGLQTILAVAPEFGAISLIGTGVGALDGSPSDRAGSAMEAFDRGLGFQFKMPTIDPKPVRGSFQISFKEKKEEAKYFKIDLALISPINDISWLNVEKRALGIGVKTGVRVSLKYLAALLPIIATYKASDAPRWKKNLIAGLSWIATKKLIDATEEADTRSWDWLPASISMGELDLPEGEYEVHLNILSEEGIKAVSLGSFVKKKESQVFKARVF